MIEPWIKQIQLDAVKHGMTLAAELVNKNKETNPEFDSPDVRTYNRHLSWVEQTIHAARDNLKEIPK